MSVYEKESPEYLREALSSLSHQTLLPSEVVIVEDGPISSELSQTISEFSDALPIARFPLSVNVGLGRALNIGMERCSYELVARMDTDDICVGDRFYKQVGNMVDDPDLAVLGGAIEEFDTVPGDLARVRSTPTTYKAICGFLKTRNPFNHMTVLLRKSVILSVGGYRDFPGFEDYELWTRVIAAGYKVGNLSDVLVYARVGNGMLARRSGWSYFGAEVRAYMAFYKSGALSLFEALVALMLRFFVRLIPKRLLGIVYRAFLRG